MALYTKCPACKSEIAFEPPKNIATLPEGYKHRIKCPSCGVTIGVKLNTIDRQPVNETPLAIQPLNPVQTPARYDEPEIATVPARSVDKPAKKKGTGRNIIMMIFAILFIALGAVAYLVSKGTLDLGENSFGFYYVDGIGIWDILINNFEEFSALFADDFVYGIMTLMPMISFTLAGITFVVALISAIGKKYGRAFNLIWSVIVLVVGVLVLFAPMIMMNSGAEAEEAVKIGEYFKDVIDTKSYLLFAPAALGLLQFIFSLIFLKSLEVKEKKAK